MISRHALLLLSYTDVLHCKARNSTLLDLERPLLCLELELCPVDDVSVAYVINAR